MNKLLCTPELRQHIANNMSGWARISSPKGGLRQAAVAICVVDFRGKGGVEGLISVPAESAALILTRRSQTLKNHPGQWALPGGRTEAGESPQ